MTRRVVVDVANYQGVPNFAAMRRQDPALAGVIIKATEGMWQLTNPYMDAQYRAAKAAGLAVGFYTFWHPGFAGTADAKLFLARIAGYKAELGVWVDAEVSDGVPAGQMLGRITEDLNAIAPSYPLKTGIYSAGWWWNPNTVGSAAAHMEKWPLWVAGYTAALPPLPTPWKQAILWQFTDHYAPGGGNMDASVFLGSDAQWQWLLTGSTPQPPSIPAEVKKIQIIVHGKVDGIFAKDTDLRTETVRAFRVGPAAIGNAALVKRLQQVMAFPGASANGKWDKNTQDHWLNTVAGIRMALNLPANGGWDAALDRAYLAIDPMR